MIEDLQTSGRARLAADVFIVGTGPVGLALARELDGSGLRVIVAESGGLTRDEASDRLNRGLAEGMPARRLVDSRARAFGGGTLLWPGQCMRFDAHDLRGWPYAPSELTRYYARAEALLGLPAGWHEPHPWRRFRVDAPSFSLPTPFAAFAPKRKLAAVLRPVLERSSNIRVLLHATAVAVHDGGLEIAAPAGVRVAVDSPVTVLCAGAVENARLLLAAGLGGDGVGSFAEHPAMWCGAIESTRPDRLQQLFSIFHRRGTRWQVKLQLPPREGPTAVANVVIQHGPDWGVDAAVRLLRRNGSARDVVRVARHARWGASAVRARALGGRASEPPPRSIALLCIAEQSNDGASSVRLSDEVDELGVPKPIVDWQPGETERATFEAMTNAVAEELGALGLGTVTPSPWLTDGSWREHVFDTFHHLGTTPMGSATDEDGRVHGVEGVFVCGGATFPTTGAASPTLTMVALALKLADRLRR